MPKDLGIEVKDFGTSWRDGMAFLGLINAIDENLIDVDYYRNTTNRNRLITGFNVAETELGIAKLLDAEDVDVAKPDEKSIMTYVAQFLHKYPEPRVIMPSLRPWWPRSTNPFPLLSRLCKANRPPTITFKCCRTLCNGSANKSSNTTT